nr:hypothetical protein [Bacillus sonorensis]
MLMKQFPSYMIPITSFSRIEDLQSLECCGFQEKFGFTCGHLFALFSFFLFHKKNSLAKEQ